MINGQAKLRRRWWRSLAVLLILGGLALGIPIWNNHIDSRTHAWLAIASERNLVVKYETVGMIPGYEYELLARKILGKRRIGVVIYDNLDAWQLTRMPPCPVKLVVETVASTPPEVVARLRERFGSAVQ